MALRRHLHLHGFTRDDLIRPVDEHHLQRELSLLERVESGLMALLPGHRLRGNFESVSYEKVQKARSASGAFRAAAKVFFPRDGVIVTAVLVE